MRKHYTPASEAGKDLASLIDHTMLKSNACETDIIRLCSEAVYYGFAAACILPHWIKTAHRELAGSPVKTATVVGFPLGLNLTRVKEFEAGSAVKLGAQELDMVINVAMLRDGNIKGTVKDIRSVVRAADRVPVKVILETCLLTRKEKISACLACMEAGASFVKTSTGLVGPGATPADVRLMRKTVGTELGVKASGGIRSLKDARSMVRAGANRIGTSAGVSIVTSSD